MREQITKLLARFDPLRKQTLALRNQRDNLKKQNSTLRNQRINLTNQMREQITKLLARFDTLRKQTLALRNQRDNLKKQNSTLRNQRDNLKKQNSTLRNQRDNLKKQNSTLRNQRDNLKSLAACSGELSLLNDLASNTETEATLIRWFRKNCKAKTHRIILRSVAHALAQNETLQQVGLVCSGIQAASEGFSEAALSYFERLPLDLVLAHASGEYFKSLNETGHPLSAELARDLISGKIPVDSATLFNCAKSAAGAGRLDLAESLARKATAERTSLDEPEILRLDWMLAELDRRKKPQSLGQNYRRGDVAIALLDYKMLDYDRASSNLGDYVQTLAMISNLVRFSDLSFSSDEAGVAEYLSELASCVQTESRLQSADAKVHIEIINRDAASARPFDQPVWLIAFGWYMHPEFKNLYNFPFPENIRPIFISFHINDRAMLNEAAVQYLAKHAPIGCRDWSTVYTLREFGIPAFFSGCITTTLGKLFPPTSEAGVRKGTAFVDTRPTPGDQRSEMDLISTQVGPDIRNTGFVKNLRSAREMLDNYRRYGRIATSRLHCYLPSKALGLEVEFRPKNRADVRFEGLLDLSDNAFSEIREGIESKLQAVFTKVLSGASEEDVYREWRQMCRADLQHAETYCTNIAPLPPPSFDPKIKAKELVASAKISPTLKDTSRESIPVAFACDNNMAEILPVALESAWRNSTRHLHFHVMTRGLADDYHHRLSRNFGDVAGLTTYNFDAVDFGDKLKMLAHTTVSTMDRLLLPDLLPDLHKLIYLDADVVVLGDLAELWTTDLTSACLAGKASNYSAWKYVYKLVGKSAATLTPEKAWQLRRNLSASGIIKGRAFNAGVLVLNLDQMRRDDFAYQHIPLIEQYAMNDQDALNVYARGRWLELPTIWNAVPSQDDTTGAKLLHFAGTTKPWNAAYISRKEDFVKYEALYRDRTAQSR
jgi:lipopolysaccharide biosynthesis glycosyltransferase/phage regulator Rha-like protein